MTELGIFGGSFDPVHNGHIVAAARILQECPLDRLILVPAGQPPHKSLAPGSDPSARLAMLRLAFPSADSPDSKISISEFELFSDRPSYTALTLQHFAKDTTRLTLFCGTDMFLSMDTWYRPDIIFSLARIAHVPRTDLSEQDKIRIQTAEAFYKTTYSASILHLSSPPLPLSSTQVREKIRLGQSTIGLVPPAVADYINQHGLYRGGGFDA